MNKQTIELSRFLQKGQVVCKVENNLLHMTTNRAIPTQRFDREHLSIVSYIHLSEKFKLPVRIDITVKIDAPGLYVLFGKGHVNFGTLCFDNRRIDDIVSPTRKTAFFHNDMPLNEFTELSLIYDLNEMQILIEGEERYYSKSERYMKARELTRYRLDEKSKAVCHGKLKFTMNASGFEDARIFINEINALKQELQPGM